MSTLILTLGLTSCGETSKKYPASKSEGVYFTVPNKWSEVSFAALNKYEKKSSANNPNSRFPLVKWQIAFSPDESLKASDIFNLKTPKSPIVFVRVRDLDETEINEVSYNWLRDAIVPVTKLASGQISSEPGFEVISDKEVVEKAARGVETVYTLSINGAKQTISQTTLLANDRKKMYIFVARCATKCFNKKKSVINQIVNSFTVQGAK